MTWLFGPAYATGDNVTNENSYKKYFLPRLKIKNYNIEIDGRNFYDQSINDSVKQYDEIILLEKQMIQLGFIIFLNNQKKQY